jgi:hypothetical protein
MEGDNKNNEGKPHKNKTQMENMQSVTTCKKSNEAKSFKRMKINI